MTEEALFEMTDELKEYHRILHALKQPFDIGEIRWRVGSTWKNYKAKGQELEKFPKMTFPLAYIDARALYDQLDEICIYGWQIKTEEFRNLGAISSLGIRFSPDGEWVWRSNVGADSNFEAAKGAASDAHKRAGVTWGVGRYLYHIDHKPVRVDVKGRIDRAVMDRLRREHIAQVQVLFSVELKNKLDAPVEEPVGAVLGHDPAPDADLPTEHPASQIPFAQELAAFTSIPELVAFWNNEVPATVKETNGNLALFQKRLGELKEK